MFCENCGREHDGSYASGRFCSARCSRSYSARSNNEQRISKIKKASEVAIASGRHHNFSGGASIIESYWRDELLSRGLMIEQHYPISCEQIDNSNHYYRLDFLVENSVDLEIDGDRFHIDDKTVSKDIDRDMYLESLGIQVYRVPYVNPKRKHSEFLEQVDEFINWYNSEVVALHQR